jgi:ASCH domain.
MKALSLIQPWATLIAVGAKRVETRAWSTDYRGALAIHASKWLTQAGRVLNHDVPECCQGEPFCSALTQGGIERIADLPSGAIVAVARLVGVRPTATFDVDGYEREFGDYYPGRYAWCLDDVRQLPVPIPYRGARGLWELPDDVLSAGVR